MWLFTLGVMPYLTFREINRVPCAILNRIVRGRHVAQIDSRIRIVSMRIYLDKYMCTRPD